MSQNSIRFGVTDHAGMRAETWKCWTEVGSGKKDVYVACRDLKSAKLHLSLHEAKDRHHTPGWHLAFEKPGFNELFEDASRPETRFIDEWVKPAPIIEGLTLACRVLVPCYSVTIADEELDSKVTWIQAAPHGRGVEVAVFLSERELVSGGWPGRHAMGTKFVGSFQLDGGGCVYAVYRTVPTGGLEPRTMVSPRYFRGASERDLFETGARTVFFGALNDGSVTFLASAITVTRNGSS